MGRKEIIWICTTIYLRQNGMEEQAWDCRSGSLVLEYSTSPPTALWVSIPSPLEQANYHFSWLISMAEKTPANAKELERYRVWCCYYAWDELGKLQGGLVSCCSLYSLNYIHSCGNCKREDTDGSINLFP